MVYDLAGKELQALETGRLNNVDVRQHASISNATNAWITGSNRTHNIGVLASILTIRCNILLSCQQL